MLSEATVKLAVGNEIIEAAEGLVGASGEAGDRQDAAVEGLPSGCDVGGRVEGLDGGGDYAIGRNLCVRVAAGRRRARMQTL